jgi:glycosyl-4,4'-diaponeurosporenoate acyltransferase
VLITFSFSSSVALLFNAMAWTLWGFGTGWYYRRRPETDLEHPLGILRIRDFEVSGLWYERQLRIKTWKDHLPETGAWFGAFSKRQLPGHDRHSLQWFANECRRGELTHWSILAATPLFALWNSGWLLAFAVLIGLAASLPFIAVLRYNRARIEAILERRIEHR